jgi:hypothetical protein
MHTRLLEDCSPDYTRPLAGLAMATKKIEPGTFRVARVQGHEVHLEFDGLTGLRQGLDEFVRSWSASPVRPTGACFAVWVEGRDFASPFYWGPNQPTIPVSLGSYLLLRVDEDHPYFGNKTPGWILVSPNPDCSQPAEIVSSIPDERAASMSPATWAPEPACIVGP